MERLRDVPEATLTKVEELGTNPDLLHFLPFYSASGTGVPEPL